MPSLDDLSTLGMLPYLTCMAVVKNSHASFLLLSKNLVRFPFCLLFLPVIIFTVGINDPDSEFQV